MSWLFLPGGLLMPSDVPMNLADEKYTLGTRNLQVRARVESHLTNFIRDYMEPMKLDYSEIEATPQMDYNFRFYTTREDFAKAVAQTVMDIDYEKFKPTAEWVDATTHQPLFKDGKEYHDVLNSIWGTVTKLGSPGGMWGRYDEYNPNGYKSASEYSKLYGTSKGYDDWKTGDSFRTSTTSDMDFTPGREEDAQEIIDQMEGIPLDQWEEFLAPWEWSLVQPYMNDVRVEKRRAARRARRQKARNRNKGKSQTVKRNGNKQINTYTR